jgi:hypothetical protein
MPAPPFNLARTFDPNVSKQLGESDPKPDLAQARNWYQKAEEWGAPEARRQLDALASLSALTENAIRLVAAAPGAAGEVDGPQRPAKQGCIYLQRLARLGRNVGILV